MRKPKRKSCVAPGQARRYLMENFTLPAGPGDNVVCRSGHVLQLYIGNDKSPKATMNRVKELFGLMLTYNQILPLVNRVGSLIKNFHRENSKRCLEDICNEEFLSRYPPPKPPRKVSEQPHVGLLKPPHSPFSHSLEGADRSLPQKPLELLPISSSSSAPEPSSFVEIPSAESSSSQEQGLPLSTKSLPSTSADSPSVQLRSSAQATSIREKVLAKRLLNMAKVHSQETHKKKKKLKTLKEALSATQNQLKFAKFTIARKNKTLKEIRSEKTATANQLRNREKELKLLRKRCKEVTQEYEKKIAELLNEGNKKLQEQRKRNKSLELEVALLKKGADRMNATEEQEQWTKDYRQASAEKQTQKVNAVAGEEELCLQNDHNGADPTLENYSTVRTLLNSGLSVVHS